MQQYVYCLGYVSFVFLMCSLPGLVLYSVQNQTKLNRTKNYELYYSLKMVD